MFTCVCLAAPPISIKYGLLNNPCQPMSLPKASPTSLTSILFYIILAGKYQPSLYFYPILFVALPVLQSSQKWLSCRILFAFRTAQCLSTALPALSFPPPWSLPGHTYLQHPSPHSPHSIFHLTLHLRTPIEHRRFLFLPFQIHLFLLIIYSRKRRLGVKLPSKRKGDVMRNNER